MEICCGFATAVDTPGHIRLAEDLGYSTAWCFNSPAIYADPWMALALAAQLTGRIGLGIAVIVPHLRHVVDVAGAVATLAARAPGRVQMAVGAGFTSTAMLGRPPVRWAEVEKFTASLRELLAGHEIEWDGAATGLFHGVRSGIQLPVEVPIWIAAQGPRGHGVAERVGDGLMSGLEPGGRAALVNGRFCALALGTVLDDGESVTSPRVLEAAGPAAALALHLGEFGPLAGSPEIAGYFAAVGDVDQTRRHLVIHQRHLIDLTDLDRRFITERAIRSFTITGTRDEVKQKLDAFSEAGATAVLYQPAGPDIPRELAAFAEVAGP